MRVMANTHTNIIDQAYDLMRLAKDLVLEKDDAYAERNLCVALIAKWALAQGLKAGLGRHPEDDKDWDEDWRTIVYVHTSIGQMSWHIHDDEVPLFNFLPIYDGEWDGHTTEQKYVRLKQELKR